MSNHSVQYTDWNAIREYLDWERNLIDKIREARRQYGDKATIVIEGDRVVIGDGTVGSRPDLIKVDDPAKFDPVEARATMPDGSLGPAMVWAGRMNEEPPVDMVGGFEKIKEDIRLRYKENQLLAEIEAAIKEHTHDPDVKRLGNGFTPAESAKLIRMIQTLIGSCKQ